VADKRKIRGPMSVVNKIVAKVTESSKVQSTPKKKKKSPPRNPSIERFRDIMDEINSLVDEAYQLTVKVLGRQSQTTRAADNYWRPHIKSIVSGAGSMETMQDTLEDMEEEISVRDE
jgi:hypothetical protein